ncbi:hypothetical protein N9291_01060 [bacterium]|nr:hypothetical protein [bacterium]
MRFGVNLFTIFGMIMFISISGNSDIFISDVIKTNPTKLGFLVLPTFVILLIVVWIATYRILGSIHP